MTLTDRQGADGNRWITPATILLLMLGTILRFAACAEPPRNSGDCGRQLLTGAMLRADGWSAASRPVAEWSPRLSERVSWGEIPANYPPLALAFFQLIASLHPTLFTFKLALTLLEAVNTALVFRLTGDRLLAAIYWCLPLSIWWVSHEGAFEPLQSTFMFLAVLALPRRIDLALAALLLAVQVKLASVFLIPLIAWHWWRSSNIRLTALGWSVLAIGPTLLAMLSYPVFRQTLRTLAWEAKFNP